MTIPGVGLTSPLDGGAVEPSDGLFVWQPVQGAARYQFERLGYFCVDPSSTPGNLVINRTVALRDTWAKIEAKSSHEKAQKHKM